MAFKLKHHTVYRNDPLIETITPGSSTGAVSLDAFQGRVLNVPNSLILAPHGYIFLQPSSDLTYVTGDFSWPIVIANCKATQRTTVLMVGQNEVDPDQYKDHLEFLRDGKEGLVIDIICFDPDGGPWRDFEADIRRLGAPHQLSFTSRYKDAGTARAFAVEKATSIITMYHPTPHCNDFLPDSDDFSLPFKILAALAIAAHAVDHPNTAPPMFCEYDGTKRVDRLPILPERARDAVKVARRKKHIRPENDPAGAWAELEELMVDAKMMEEGGLQGRVTMSARLMGQLGPFCTVCAEKHGLSRCAGCRVDYYCSKDGGAHQKEDWPRHKEWCKKNRVPKASTA
ncbi:hypothetical protein BCR35DRAFT_330623 [Leucosporidium creatinivorum]|uniref:MYND-type domain-containing protein n=1 Tax=Leucosporidium creatinivorum TaxID=106004 RepID=A0A1Y2FVN1_9BASI|nr:hypothetical protein BCR35DRAFT_330623 [Leucosporidium creatinivorum]